MYKPEVDALTVLFNDPSMSVLDFHDICFDKINTNSAWYTHHLAAISLYNSFIKDALIIEQEDRVYITGKGAEVVQQYS